ncbi:rho guanine nucleotide exchange factor 33 [Vanacampus margaritifer]
MEDSPRRAQDHTEDVSPHIKYKEEDKSVQDANMEVAQLQGLVAELHELRQKDLRLEESLQAHQTDVDDKIMGLKNSLNTFKEELSAAFFHIQDVSNRQQELIKQLEQLQPETPITVPHRKSSKSDVLSASEDERICAPGQSELSIIQRYFGESPQSQRSVTSTQTSTSEQQRCPSSRSTALGDGRNGREDTQTPDSPNENSLRQKAALELLESERIYVSHLSLLLKANISFNGSEALVAKDKRPFPSSLRFLIQQHLDLLHTLQERVLRCQWQGIMGDIFMRLTSKESDFLDLYVSYLKELPDCLAVVSMMASNAVKSSAFLESDIMGDDSKPSLHMLLLQPVQRIPEYLQLLQALLRQTEDLHPDYYLLLVCIQQFRYFSSQQQHLLQRSQELLMHHRQEVKSRSSMKQLLRTMEGGLQGSPYPHSSTVLEHTKLAKHSKQRLLEQIQSSHRFHERDRMQVPEFNCYDPEWPPQLHYYNPDVDSRKHKPTGLGSIPETEASERPGQHHLPSRPSEFRHVQPGSALADALGEFLLPPDPPGMECLYEEERSSLHDASAFDGCSSASSDSSIDIAFVKCPKAPVTPSRHAPTSRDIFGNGYNKLPNRGCVSPDEAVLMRQAHQRPLQPSQRKKSKSLNGLQMDSTVMDGGHAKLERQGSRGCATPSRKIHSSPGSRKEGEKPTDDLHGLLGMDTALQSWGAEENHHHTPFSERSRKQDKGGFRSSFKKLFKKKGGDDKKEKAAQKGQENQQADVRGTAV